MYNYQCVFECCSHFRILPPQPSWVTKIDTLTCNPWEIRGCSVFMPCFFKACFIDTQGHLRVSGRIWTQFSADLACFMVGSTLSDTFYCSSFLKNLKLFIEEVPIHHRKILRENSSEGKQIPEVLYKNYTQWSRSHIKIAERSECQKEQISFHQCIVQAFL